VENPTFKVGIAILARLGRGVGMPEQARTATPIGPSRGSLAPRFRPYSTSMVISPSTTRTGKVSMGS
jgi:hypothetical protein